MLGAAGCVMFPARAYATPHNLPATISPIQHYCGCLAHSCHYYLPFPLSLFVPPSVACGFQIFSKKVSINFNEGKLTIANTTPEDLLCWQTIAVLLLPVIYHVWMSKWVESEVKQQVT